jgi:hypothetical protein
VDLAFGLFAVLAVPAALMLESSNHTSDTLTSTALPTSAMSQGGEPSVDTQTGN